MTAEARRVGREAEPVLVLDDVLSAPDAIVAEAKDAAFGPIGPHYPGVRALARRDTVEAVLAAALPAVLSTFGARGARVTMAVLSLATTPAAALRLPQRVPHYDGVERERLALMLYLSGPEQGGTSFYRHRATGFETVTAARVRSYLAALEAEFRRAAPPAGYIAGDTAQFVRTGGVEARVNRLVAYRGNLLHSADLRPERLSVDPRTGRLTLNIFLALAE